MHPVAAPVPDRPEEPRALPVDGALLDEAASLALDAGAVVATALKGAIAAEKARRWREENAGAIAHSNEEQRRNGLWSDGIRLF